MIMNNMFILQNYSIGDTIKIRQVMLVWNNTEARSCNHVSLGKDVGTEYCGFFIPSKYIINMLI